MLVAIKLVYDVMTGMFMHVRSSVLISNMPLTGTAVQPGEHMLAAVTVVAGQSAGAGVMVVAAAAVVYVYTLTARFVIGEARLFCGSKQSRRSALKMLMMESIVVVDD